MILGCHHSGMKELVAIKEQVIFVRKANEKDIGNSIPILVNACTSNAASVPGELGMSVLLCLLLSSTSYTSLWSK